jgi:hypothetical protein
MMQMTRRRVAIASFGEKRVGRRKEGRKEGA